jgi:hypothetical protein
VQLSREQRLDSLPQAEQQQLCHQVRIVYLGQIHVRACIGIALRTCTNWFGGRVGTAVARVRTVIYLPLQVLHRRQTRRYTEYPYCVCSCITPARTPAEQSRAEQSRVRPPAPTGGQPAAQIRKLTSRLQKIEALAEHRHVLLAHWPAGRPALSLSLSSAGHALTV